MKLLAIRMRDVGHFSSGVALEGLSGGLDVLSGPNEIGKSTVFRAIETVFLKKYKTAALNGLTPQGGGEPLIEADFEVAGRSFRICKQYLRKSSAVLSDLVSGRIEAKGADAEAQLAELLGLGTEKAGRLGLLWIGQGAAHRAHAPDERQELPALQAVIEREIAATAGGGRHHSVRARVKALLDVQMTPSRDRAKARSPYWDALVRRDEAEAAVAKAKALDAQIAEQLERLGVLQAALREIEGPVQRQRLVDALAAAGDRIDTVRKAQALHADARVKAGEAREALQSLRTFDGRLQELADLAAAEVVERSNAAVLVSQQATADSEHAEAAAGVIAAERDERAILSRQAAHAAAELSAAHRQQWAELEKALVSARSLATRITSHEQALAANPVTAQRLAAIERETREIEALEARLGAALPSLSLSYLPGAEGRIRVAGAALAAGVHAVDGSMILDIEGIGRLTVAAGAVTELESDRGDLAAHRAQRDALLAACGAESVADARSRCEARSAIERQRGEARARLGGIAPNGLAVLEADAQRLADLIAVGVSHAPVEAHAAGDDLTALLAAARQRLADARRSASAAADAQAAARAKRSASEAVMRSLVERRVALERSLPLPAVRDAERARLANASEAAQAGAAAAGLAATALAAQPPTDADFQSLAALHARAGQALQDHDAARHKLELEIRGLESWIERASEEGAGTSLLVQEGELARAARDVARHETEIEALRLLADELDRAESDALGAFIEPVTRRLVPSLARLFPNGRIGFERGLKVAMLERGGVAESVSQLSDGTQEQIAVLVRLAFGRLLAEGGAPAPLILDDAIVYADDERIEQLFSALRESATFHQVIVLTCRSRTFEALGGRRLALAPWTPA